MQMTPRADIVDFPVLSADSRGRIHFVWIDYRDLANLVWYTRSDDRGLTWAVQRPIAKGNVDLFWSPTITVHEDLVMVSWPGPAIIDNTKPIGLTDVISVDGGISWYSERDSSFALGSTSRGNATGLRAAVDPDGTAWAAGRLFGSRTPGDDGIAFAWWNAPPSAPTIQSVTVSGHDATVRWTAAIERDVAGFGVWRSPDKTNWAYVAGVSG